MALRAVPDHPKFAALKSAIGQPKGAVIGWLEIIWHFTGRFTPRGNIGKYSDQAIEAWVEWNGKPGALIAALVSTGWLDKHEEHRLLVHDWSQHADKATKNALSRADQTFYCQPVRTVYVQCTDMQPESGTVYALPEPEPVPEPVRKNIPREVVEEIYQAYPKHEGKLDALRAIEKAIRSNGNDAGWYLERVRAYALQSKDSDPKFIPYPATWFNKGNYLNESLSPQPRFVETTWEETGVVFDRERNCWVDKEGKMV